MTTATPTSRASSRRRFLRQSTAALGAMLVAPLFRVSSALADGAKRLMEHNWAGNLRYSAARLLKPKTAAEVQELVLLGAKPKALGSRHSFSTIADTTGDLISLENLRGIQINPRALTVTVGAGIRYGDLVDTLQKNRLALRNLASLPHISVAGAIATGTHGSGDENGNLSTHVLALELVTADGKVLKLSRDKDPERFYGAVVNLGALGIVTSVTLEVIPTFDVQQVVYEFLPLKALYADFDAVMGSAYSVSLFIDWQSETVNQVWQKHFRLSEGDFVAPAEWLGAKRAAKDLHPIVTMDAKPCTPQMGVAGPWFSRLPHFKMEFTPSSGKELQTEMFVPRKHAVAAIKAVHALAPKLKPVLQISEVRTMKGDTLWMSPAYGRDTVAIHFTWTDDEKGVRAVLPELEAALKPFDARPHWGKLYAMSRVELEKLYPKMAAFRKLADELDPKGVFRNDYLTTNVFGS